MHFLRSQSKLESLLIDEASGRVDPLASLNGDSLAGEKVLGFQKLISGLLSLNGNRIFMSKTLCKSYLLFSSTLEYSPLKRRTALEYCSKQFLHTTQLTLYPMFLFFNVRHTLPLMI
jgi:hypothetical protein